MPPNLRIFLVLYIFFGAGMASITKFQPLTGKLVEDARLQLVLDIAIRILAWPYALTYLFGRPGTGYGYMGGALAVIILVVLWGISLLIDTRGSGRNL